MLERLCRLDELEDPGSRGFVVALGEGGPPFSLFVVRKGDVVRAYLNRCPHTGVALEWVPHQFLDCSGGFIECSVHGALFDIADGRCLRGPCVGEALEAVALEVRDGVLFLRHPDPPQSSSSRVSSGLT